MKAKIKSTQQVIEVTCIDATDPNISNWTYEDKNAKEAYLYSELEFEDLTDYKTWTEDLIKQIAVREFYSSDCSSEYRAEIANAIVLFAFAVCDRMMQENKTWRR